MSTSCQPFETESVVRALYAALLQRDPDPGGLRYWSDDLASRLARQPHHLALATLVDDLLGNDEVRRKLSSRLSADPSLAAEIRQGEAMRASIRAEFLHPGRPDPGPVIGLGTHCYAASLLSRFGWRNWSGPFDWIFCTPEMVCDCIDDDFEEFLDPAHYRRVPIEERSDPDVNRVSHTLFEARYTIPDPVFNHTDADVPEGWEYLRRCTDRFRAALRHRGELRFLQVLPEPHAAPARFERTLETLRRHCHAPRLVVVAVAEPSSHTAVAPVIDTMSQQPDGCMVGFTPTSRWRATRFDDLIDDLNVARAVQHAFDGLRAPIDVGNPVASR